MSSSTLLAELNRIDKDIADQEKKKAGFDKKASDLEKKVPVLFFLHWKSMNEYAEPFHRKGYLLLKTLRCRNILYTGERCP